MYKESEILTTIESNIFILREKQVILDRDLALFFQTETRSIKQAVKRNKDRFPYDFIFELNNNEIEYLVSTTHYI